MRVNAKDYWSRRGKGSARPRAGGVVACLQGISMERANSGGKNRDNRAGCSRIPGEACRFCCRLGAAQAHRCCSRRFARGVCCSCEERPDVVCARTSGGKRWCGEEDGSGRRAPRRARAPETAVGGGARVNFTRWRSRACAQRDRASKLFNRGVVQRPRRLSAVSFDRPANAPARARRLFMAERAAGACVGTHRHWVIGRALLELVVVRDRADT